MAKKYASLGQLVREARETRGMTANHLCKIAGLSPATIPKIESGVMSPGWEVMRRICFALGIGMDAIAEQQEPVELLPPPAPRGRPGKMAKPKEDAIRE